jgi:hypothetical protein
MEPENYRRRVVHTALQLTQDTPLAAGPYECQLLEQFVIGQLTIEEVMVLLEAPAGLPLAA